MQVGDQVIFYHYRWAVGTVERLGDYSASVRGEGSLEYLHRRIRLHSIYPYTPENAKRLEEMRAIEKQIAELTKPLYARIDQLVTEIRGM